MNKDLTDTIIFLNKKRTEKEDHGKQYIHTKDLLLPPVWSIVSLANAPTMDREKAPVFFTTGKALLCQM